MDVEFAAYGERNGAHAVLAATFHDSVVERTLQITDLAWGLPDHLGEIPMYRGRPDGNYYVLVKTLRDSEASRSGMAASVAAFFPLDEIVHDSNFNRFVDIMPTPAHISPELQSLKVSQLQAGVSFRENTGVQALIHALFTHKSGPLVWGGIESFINVLTDLWMRLPPTMRRSFSFAFVCDPSDGNKRDCSVIYCPEELASRWTGQLITKEMNQSENLEPASEQYFFNDSFRQQVDGMIEDLGAVVCSFEDLGRACSCYVTLGNLFLTSDLDATKLLRNISILSPTKELGSAIKETVISDICRRIRSGGIVTIGLIRNIDFNLFSASEKVNEACFIGIQHSLNNESTCAKSISELIMQAVLHCHQSWADGVIRGMNKFIQSGSKVSVRRIWELLEKQPDLAVHATMLFPDDHKIDSVFAAVAPSKIDQILAEGVRQFAIQQSFPELHAVALSQLYPVDETLRNICETWTSAHRLTSLRRLCNRVDHNDILKYVDQHEEEEIINIAADLCISDPTLLRVAFSGSSQSWRSVLCRIIEISPETINLAGDINTEVTKSLQLLIEDRLESSYQISLSNTKYANLLAVENRSKLWSQFDSNASPEFLKETARAWIKLAHKGLTALETVEPELLDTILGRDMRTTLLPSDANGVVQIVANVFEILPQLQENDFEQWRQRFLRDNPNLSKVDAIFLGQFVQERGWEHIAENLANDVVWYKRSDLRPAVGQFLDLLGWLKRWQVGDSEVNLSTDEWWNELETNLIGLYSEGPSSNGIWERAGGSLADLLTSGTGASQWRYCLRELRNGFRSGKLSIESLLRLVSNDYPNNLTLQFLRENRPK